jgi:hypothetical protein
MAAIGVRSRTGSNGSGCGRPGASPICESVAVPSTSPVGGCLETKSTPITSPAAARFSTTTGWPRVSETFGAQTRVGTSVPPPGARGMISRTGRVGQVCAHRCCEGERRGGKDGATAKRRVRYRISLHSGWRSLGARPDIPAGCAAATRCPSGVTRHSRRRRSTCARSTSSCTTKLC